MDVVVTVVKNAASSGLIHGSRVYRRDKTDGIEGAEFAAKSGVFPDTPAAGHVFYKVGRKAVAPEHFPGSTGAGTVTVRYLLEPLDANRIKLRIDAVFFEESLRARYFSDGSVEEAEYDVIQTQPSSPLGVRTRYQYLEVVRTVTFSSFSSVRIVVEEL